VPPKATGPECARPDTLFKVIHQQEQRLNHEGVQENVMFAPKDLRPSEIMALRTLIGGRTGNMPWTLEGIIESACLWACLGAGFEHEQS